MSNASEKYHEREYAKRVVLLGGICDKQGSMGPFGRTGPNDRLTLLPKRIIFFVEFKRRDKDSSKTARVQKKRHKHIKRLGFKSYIAYSWQDAIKITKKHLRKKGVPYRHVKGWN